MLPRIKKGMKVLYKSKNKRCTTVISNANSNKSDNLNIPNNYIIILTSNHPHRTVQNESSFNTHITLQKVTYLESSASINDETTDQINISEDSLSHQNAS